MSQSPRPGRLADQIQEEISDIAQRRLKDPRRGFFTVTGVEVTRDLRQATIYISTLDSAELESTLETLERAKGFFRTELGRRIRIRFLPELRFLPDRSAERGRRIEDLLKEIHQEEEGDAGEGDP
jgi:ribosome-binding factor A